ncbi:DUF6177 family protein [Arthrobacter sp. zg-Y40]|uniref:DUF6177 family protein n=1 Tax=Arthrobacter sp. zg-Y40 TaxID=2886939 RepID=UPI001D152E2D|nr:DUF6177 family protein [Arthrobacter sp. zg-Y40]MCC3280232.1 DUF6177 family protein [Arthrobacter sp. zg-Y40]
MSEASFDLVLGSSAVLFQDKPVAALTPWVLRAHTAAAAAGLDFVLLTPGSTRITLPLAELLGTGGGQWLVTGSGGSLYNGMTGREYDWSDVSLTPEDSLAEEFLAVEPNQTGYVHVRAATLHPASYRTRAGSFTEQIFAAVTGLPPRGWGVCEPVSEAWNVDAASAFCYDRSPNATRLEVVGSAVRQEANGRASAGSIGVMTVERTSRGVLESIELLAASPDPLSPEQVQRFADGAHRARARTAVLGQGIGYHNLNRPARFTGLVVPRCALFGPEALAGVGPERALAAAGEGSRLTGGAPLQSLVVEYPAEPLAGRVHPVEAYAVLAAALGAGEPGAVPGR